MDGRKEETANKRARKLRKNRDNLLSFLRGGFYPNNNGRVDWAFNVGRYWEFELYSDLGARSLNFDSTYLYPQHANDKGAGFPIRCVVKP